MWNCFANSKNNILKVNQNLKSDKTPCIFYAGPETFIKKIDNCTNNPEKSLATKIGEHITCGYSMLTVWAFNNIKK